MGAFASPREVVAVERNRSRHLRVLGGLDHGSRRTFGSNGILLRSLFDRWGGLFWSGSDSLLGELSCRIRSHHGEERESSTLRREGVSPVPKSGCDSISIPHGGRKFCSSPRSDA